MEILEFKPTEMRQQFLVNEDQHFILVMLRDADGRELQLQLDAKVGGQLAGNTMATFMSMADRAGLDESSPIGEFRKIATRTPQNLSTSISPMQDCVHLSFERGTTSELHYSLSLERAGKLAHALKEAVTQCGAEPPATRN